MIRQYRRESAAEMADADLLDELIVYERFVGTLRGPGEPTASEVRRAEEVALEILRRMRAK